MVRKEYLRLEICTMNSKISSWRPWFSLLLEFDALKSWQSLGIKARVADKHEPGFLALVTRCASVPPVQYTMRIVKTGCCGSVAEHKPGTLGLIPGDCQLFNSLFSFTTPTCLYFNPLANI